MEIKTLNGFVPIARSIQQHPIYSKPLAWRAAYLHIRLNVNWDDDKPIPGLNKNEGHFDFSKVGPELDKLDRHVWRRAIEWMKGTPNLSPRDPQYMRPMIEAQRTTRGLRITWLPPEHEITELQLEFIPPPETTTPPTAPPAAPQAASQANPPPKKTVSHGKTKVTWLTPFNDAWKAVAGGDLMFKRDCTTLAPLVDEFGAEVVLEYFKNYLASNPPAMCSVARFQTTFKTWSKVLNNRKGQVSEANYSGDFLEGIK